MLSSHERRIWRDIERNYADEVDRRPGDGRSGDQLPTAVVIGLWTTILLILFGAALAGFVVGAGTAAGWLLWRYRPLLRGDEPTWVDPFDEAIRRRARTSGTTAGPPPGTDHRGSARGTHRS